MLLFSKTNNGYIHQLNCSKNVDLLKRDVNNKSINTNLLVTCKDATVQKKLAVNILKPENKKIENVEKLIISSFVDSSDDTENDNNGDVKTLTINIENLILAQSPRIPYILHFMQAGSYIPELDDETVNSTINCFNMPVFVYDGVLSTQDPPLIGKHDVFVVPAYVLELRVNAYVYGKNSIVSVPTTNVGDLTILLCDDNKVPYESESIATGYVGDNSVSKTIHTIRHVLKTPLAPFTPFSISHRTSQNGSFYLRTNYYLVVY